MSSLFTRIVYGLGLCALVLCVLVGGRTTLAAGPEFTDISQTDFDGIIRETSANSTLRSVMPPASLGRIWGFELGLVAGVTKSPEIQRIVAEADPETKVSAIPHAGLIGAVTVPFGITAEAVYLPEIDTDEFKFQQYALAAKWTFSDVVLPAIIPVNLAVRGFLGKTEMVSSQVINNASTSNTDVNVEVNFDNTVTGIQLLASPKLIPIVEPYVGVGYLKAKGSMAISGSTTATFFSGFTAGQSAESTPSSSQLLIGANVQLLILVFGAEISKAYDTSSFTAKLSLRF